MKTFTLTETQYHTLLQALNELHEMEIEMQCNDCEDDDKFYKLSEQERSEAMTHEEPFNTTATEYLLDILQPQNS
jgi:hypothetical protein